MKTVRITACALLMIAALTACEPGGDEGASPTPSQPTEPAATPSQPAEPASPTPIAPSGGTPSKTAGAPAPSGPTSLTGQVSSGVEPNCLLLDGYLLVGGPKDVLRPGSRVTVTGQVQKDLMTTCQQGIPFVVKSAKPA